jgi:hypothetical protein
MGRQRGGALGTVGPRRGRAVGLGVALTALGLVAGCAVQVNNPGFAAGPTPSATAAPSGANRAPQIPAGSAATAPSAGPAAPGQGVAALCRASTTAEFQLAVEDGSHLGPASLRYSADMWDALAASGPPEVSADAAELAVQYRVLAGADDLNSTWDRVGDTTTAAFRRVEAYANSHCESGQAK